MFSSPGISQDRAATIIQAHWRGRQARHLLPVHRARAQLRKAVQRLSRTAGRSALPTSEIISRTHDLARAYDAAGKPLLAEKCYAQAKDMATSGGCAASEAAFHIHALVAFYKRQGRHADATAVLRAAAPPPRDVGPNDADRVRRQQQQEQAAAAAGVDDRDPQLALEGKEPFLVRPLACWKRGIAAAFRTSVAAAAFRDVRTDSWPDDVPFFAPSSQPLPAPAMMLVTPLLALTKGTNLPNFGTMFGDSVVVRGRSGGSGDRKLTEAELAKLRDDLYSRNSVL